MFLKKKTQNKGMNNKETKSLDEVESRLFFLGENWFMVGDLKRLFKRENIQLLSNEYRGRNPGMYD